MDAVTPNDLNRMKSVAARLWGEGRRWTPGEIAWSLLTESDENFVEFVGEGFCWLQPDYGVIVATSEEDASTALALVAGRPVQVPDGDDLLTRAVRAHGLHPLPDAPFDLDVRLRVEEASAPELPDGYRVRSAEAGDDLVGAHRNAWRPADLPFADGQGPEVSADAASSFDDAALARVQNDSHYDIGLHVVVEDPKGELVASCIGWHDQSAGLVSIEPLGVSPAHRKHGLAGAMCLEIARRAAQRGAHEVLIHPRGDSAYPAARGAYARVGFNEVGEIRLHG